ncbi:MAG TPA: hypothetical protein VHR47_09870 [Bacillota bacterium]|nr:hypothetical protein [Bacillota bacterium]
MTRFSHIFLILLLITSFLLIPSGLSQASNNKKPCIVLVVNSLTLAEISGGSMPRLARSTDRMGIALLNLRANGANSPEKILLGLSAGAPTQANIDGDPFLGQNESYNRISALKLYTRFYGRDPRAEIFNPFYASLSLQNINSEFVNEIGYIGSMLHVRGEKTGFWGDGDPDLHTPSRSAGLIAADSRGRIDYGKVGPEIQSEDPFHPAGKRIDEQKLWSSFTSSKKPILSVIEWGEFEILDYWYPYIPPFHYNDLRLKELNRLDIFINRLTDYCSKNNRALVILTASVPKDPRFKERMGWVMILNPSWRRHGLLISATTRTPGLVTPYDIHEFLVSTLGIPSATSSIGAPINIVAGDLSRLFQFNSATNTLEDQRTPILIIIIYLFSILLIVGGAASLLIRTYGRLYHLLGSVLLWATFLPLTFSIASLVKPSNIFIHIIVGAGLALVLTALVSHIYSELTKRLEVVTLLTSMWLLFDACLGGYFSRWSVLGYSLASGARYYGLGNEYTGVLVGTALLSAGLFLQHSKATKKVLWAIGLWLIMLPLLIGFPRFGANFGDIVPMIPVLGLTFTLMSHWRIDIRRMLLFLLIITIVFTFFVLYDVRQENPTHLGRLFKDIGTNGWQVALLLVQRKLAMNWKLVQYSRWTMVVILVLIIFPISLYSPRGPLRKVFSRYTALRSAYIGISLAAIGGFVFNDSGIVAAATTLLIPSLALLLLMMELNESKSLDDVTKRDSIRIDL